MTLACPTCIYRLFLQRLLCIVKKKKIMNFFFDDEDDDDDDVLMFIDVDVCVFIF